MKVEKAEKPNNSNSIQSFHGSTFFNLKVALEKSSTGFQNSVSQKVITTGVRRTSSALWIKKRIVFAVPLEYYDSAFKYKN